MSGYTPSEEEVRDAWRAFMTEPSEYWDALDDAEADARLNRFLAEDRRKTAARALRAGVAYARPDAGDHVGMSRSEAEAFEDALGLVEEYADRIEKGGSDDDAG